MQNEMKGFSLTLLTYVLSTLTFLTENYYEIIGASCAAITTLFVCIHYSKSWKLKDMQRKKLEREMMNE